MKMMKIAHECPLSLLKESRTWNDYSYALVHLFDEHPEYCDFFKEEKKIGRHVLLDNSIFELGTAFDAYKYAERVKEYKPDEYIVPDVLEDCEGTIDQFQSWLVHNQNIDGIKIGVVQGKTMDEFIKCYLYMARHADKIAFSFDYSMFDEMVGSAYKTTNQMLGRMMLLEHLTSMNVIDGAMPHHLLGCSNPVEFDFYKHYGFIDSVDTSSPIVHAILGKRYPTDLSRWDKERIKLIEFINYSRDDIDSSILNYNIKRFRQLCK